MILRTLIAKVGPFIKDARELQQVSSKELVNGLRKG